MGEEARTGINEVSTRSVALTEQVDNRINAANDAIKSLQRSTEDVAKELVDKDASLRHHLKIERQRREEMGIEAAQQTQQVRDNLVANLQSEATDLRAMLADTRKKIYEESTALHAELREQPTKKELVELASTTTEQYNELNAVIDGHRTRLETAVREY